MVMCETVMCLIMRAKILKKQAKAQVCSNGASECGNGQLRDAAITRCFASHLLDRSFARYLKPQILTILCPLLVVDLISHDLKQ